MKPRKTDKGFVLAELIIAIALLSLVSGIILQLFLTASTTNKKAHNLDCASSCAVTAIEYMRSSPSFNFSELDFFSLADIKQSEEGAVITLFYDSNWNNIPSVELDTGFVMTITVTTISELEEIVPADWNASDEQIGGKLFKMFIDVSSAGTGEPASLLTITAGKYAAMEVHA